MRSTIKLKPAFVSGVTIAHMAGTTAYGLYNLHALNRTVSDVIQGSAKRPELTRQCGAKSFAPDMSMRTTADSDDDFRESV